MPFMNEGAGDRIVRILAGIALGYAAWMSWPGTASLVFLVIGTIALITGVVGWCALYAVFGLSTKTRAGA
jgi:hypothetical protein